MRIMLACCAGLSTSLVVEKMKEAAKVQGKEYKIWAVDQGMVEDEKGNFDVLLLGPQVQHTLKKMKKLVGDGTPVAVMKSVDYGRCNGESILKFAEELVK